MRRTVILWSREERGVAMVVAILSSMIVMSLALVAVGLANHNTSQS